MFSPQSVLLEPLEVALVWTIYTLTKAKRSIHLLQEDILEENELWNLT